MMSKVEDGKQEVIAETQARGNNNLVQKSSSGNGGEKSDLRYILKVEPTRYKILCGVGGK